MDPNAAPGLFRSALDQGSWSEARRAFAALSGWIARGGFAPAGWEGRTDLLLRACSAQYRLRGERDRPHGAGAAA